MAVKEVTVSNWRTENGLGKVWTFAFSFQLWICEIFFCPSSPRDLVNTFASFFFFHFLCEKEKDVSECVSVYVGFAIINTWWVQYVWDACSQPESRKTLGERKTSSATWDPGSDEILRMCTATHTHTHTHTHCILTLFLCSRSASVFC